MENQIDDKIEKFWDKFYKTGNIENYLKYKEVEKSKENNEEL